MSSNDLWYGVLDAGDKSSPVIRDLSMQTSNANNVWLYNHLRNAFVEYSLVIVEPKLRELTANDIPQKELDRAFRKARKTFDLARKVNKWESKASSARPARKKDAEVVMETEDEDIDTDEFIDDTRDED